MSESTLQIRNVEVSGFGNIGHVVMRELGDRIVLEGVNGVGKTMIITAIRAALEGKTGLPDRPLAEWIKAGHENAVIKIDLADGTVIKFSIRVIITAANAELIDKKKLRSDIEISIASLNASIEAFEVAPVEQIQKEIAGVKQKNEAIRKNADRKMLQQELEQSELKGNELYRKITIIKANRNAIMGTAEIPIDGLTIGDGCLLFPNSQMEMVRLSALSDGEFWPIACGLVAAFKPRVGIVIIDSLHDLDKSNFEALCAAAEKHKMQIWIHKTLWDESDAGAGFLIRDGQVVGGPCQRSSGC